MNDGRDWVLLYTWEGWIGATIGLQKPYAQNLLIHRTGGWFSIPVKRLSTAHGAK